MKKIFILLTAIVILSEIGYAKKPTMPPPNITSIRAMSTGELLFAFNNKNEVNWDIQEVSLNGYLSKKFPFGAVQLHYLKDRTKCLMINGKWLQISKCSDIDSGDFRTLFSLLPTSSGALQIQSISSEKCLMVAQVLKKTISQEIKLESCFTSPSSEIDMRWLWIITPMVGNTKLSPH